MEYNKNLYAALLKIAEKNEELNKMLESVGNDISKMKEINIQLKQTGKIIEPFKEYKQLIDDALSAEDALKTESDSEMISMYQEIIGNAKTLLPSMEEKLKILLLPVDPNNDKDVIVEIRPAAGGDEASIFTADIFDMYQRYCSNMGWKMKVTEMKPQAHGLDYVSFTISGEDVYSKMKFESGVHRVQRVPATEAKGRVQTSTVTVAVLPEQDEIDIEIKPSDLRIDTYRASGAGGQHVNRTESAVRITHIPTGIVAACQEGKSQIENRETAMRMLKTKMWDLAQKEKQAEQSNLRASQVGSGERSEKIRTYNYPQNRVTDHRIGLTLSNLTGIMMGDLEEITDALIADEQATLMSNFKL